MATRSTERSIRESRLLVSTPEIVYVELEKYGQQMKDEVLRFSDEDLETGLLARQDGLIDLALAQHCHDLDVWKALYAKSRANASGLEERYLKGLRQACLSNENARGIFHDFPHIDPTELARFLQEDSGEDLHVLLNNPAIHEKHLIQLFKGEGLFAQVDDDRRRKMLYSAAENPRLIDDESSEHGPDMYYKDMRTAIFEMVAKVPVNWQWLVTLHHLHFCLLKGETESVDHPVTEVVERWSALAQPEDKDEREGYYSDLSMKDEFIVIASAMHGRHVFKQGEGYESNIVGSLDSPKITQRCAFYGNGKLTAKDMEKAHDRDGDAYVLAALCNESVYYDRNLRKVLEEHVTYQQRGLYLSKCESIAKRKSYFDPKPLLEEMLHDDDETPPAPSNEMTGINVLAEKVTALETKFAANRSLLICGFVIIGLLIWIR